MSNKDIIVKDYDGNYLYPRAYKDYEGNVIHTTYVKGVKGNAETDYRTGNVNLTPANIGAVNKAGDTMTGNLRVVSTGEKYVEVKNSTTQANVLLDSNSTGIHGVWSGGYYTGSAYVTSSKWLLTRDTSGNVNLYGNADSATKATQDANGLNIANGYIKRTTAVFGESSGSGNIQGWWKVASGSFTTYNNTNLCWLVRDNYNSGRWGILCLEMRGNSSTGTAVVWGLRWLVRSGFPTGEFIVTASGTSWTLYGYRNNQYGKISFVQLQQKDILGTDINSVTYYNNSWYGTTAPSGTASVDAGTVNSATNATNIYAKSGSYKTVANTLLEMVYPVGSIYMSTSSASPATFLGGTWTQIKGRFLFGVGANTANTVTTYGSLAASAINRSTVKEQGGEVTHTLTVAELAQHDHNTTADTSYLYLWGGEGSQHGASGYGYWTQSGGVKTSQTGSNTAHNNMPPYYTVYMWERTA